VRQREPAHEISPDVWTVGSEFCHPPAAGRGRELLLLDVGARFTAARWRGFFRRYREDLFGFLVAWAAVGRLILSAWLAMQVEK
jgi:hypothetical protein